MTTPVDAERKVRQLDNDVPSIYERLTGISTTQGHHGNRLTELDNRLAVIAATQQRHGNRLSDIER